MIMKHTPAPWWVTDYGVRNIGGYICHTRSPTHYPGQDERFVDESVERDANKLLIAAAPDLLKACANARDMLTTDRQAFVDCARIRDSRIEEAIAYGLVLVEEDAWIDSDDAEAVRDYDRALSMIDAATAKAKGTAP